MSNLILGVISLVVCAIGYYYAYKYQARGNYRAAVLLLMAGGLLLRIYTSSDFFLHSWDERYHALVAKNLLLHPLSPTLYDNALLPYDYKNWTTNHIWLHKPPFALWLIAASMGLFGVNEIALRLPAILFTTLGIGLTFSIATYFFDKKIAFLAAFFYATNGLIIELTGGRVATDHIDVFFLFFVELAIFFSLAFAQQQKNALNFLAGVSLGAALLTKWLPALIVLPIWFLLVSDVAKPRPQKLIAQFLLLIGTAGLIFVPWQIYIFHTFATEARWEAHYNLLHFTQVIENHAGDFYYFIHQIGINYGELIYVPLLWFLWQTFKNKTDKRRIALLIWVLIPLLFFSCAATKMQGYILFISPALFMITAAFWYMLLEYKANHRFVWLFNGILILLLALPIRYMLERVKPFAQIDRNPIWVADLRKLNDQKITNGVLFNYARPIEAMFYTNLTVYPDMPSPEVIANLITQGHNVLINDNGQIPANIKAINGLSSSNPNWPHISWLFFFFPLSTNSRS